MPRAEIASKQAMHTLSQLHAELAGKLIDNAKAAARLRLAMRQVEAVMKLLQPGYDVRPIAIRRRKPNPWFKRGAILRAALDALRMAEGPLTTREIAERMLAAKGVTDPQPKALRDLYGAVQAAMRSHKGGNVIEDENSRPALWTIATG